MPAKTARPANLSPLRLILDLETEELLLALAQAQESGSEEQAGLLHALGIRVRAYAEAGEAGRRMRRELIEAAADFGIPVCAFDLAAEALA